MYVCKNCKKQFPSERSLDAHLKVHGGVEEYYSTWYPRQDLYDGSFIKFKSRKEYFLTYFNSKTSRLNFYRDNSDKRARETFEKEFDQDKDKKGYDFLPCSNYFDLSDYAGIKTIKKLFGNCLDFCKQNNLTQLYSKPLPKNFWSPLDREIEIHIDTREQLPFVFKKSISNKLDIGDYTAGGELFSKTFVDRKSPSDFISTFGSQKGFDRFKNEIERCKKFNSFLFVIVESSISDLEEFAKKSKFHAGTNFAFHNVRKILVEDKENVQFIFCPNRTAANEICERVLFHGSPLWECDIQFFINEHYHSHVE